VAHEIETVATAFTSTEATYVVRRNDTRAQMLATWAREGFVLASTVTVAGGGDVTIIDTLQRDRL